MGNIGKWTFSVLLGLFFAELLLRLAGMNQSYSESLGQGYISSFRYHATNPENTHAPNTTATIDHRDFKHQCTTSELGVREKPMSEAYDTSSYHIITLGDSFTEGVGTTYDSTWPRLLEQNLQEKKRPIQVFNAGINGDDPFFEYMLYKNKLAKLKPDMVVVAVNASDINDFFIRGGMERFGAEGKLVYKKAPALESFYQYSYIVRMVSIFILRQRQGLFVTDDEYYKVQENFVSKTSDLFRIFQKTTSPDTKLVVVIHPDATECADPNSEENVRTYRVMCQLIDSLHRNNITAINLYPSMRALIHKDNIMLYTFEHDKHYNSKGYKLWADSLTARICRVYPDIEGLKLQP
jgi:lysophospholipase L1-like esterase